MIRISAGGRTPAQKARLEMLDRAQFPQRLWRKDDTLWGTDPEHRRVAANRLGWLEVATRMRDEVEPLRAFAAKVASEGFTHCVLLGMGGSSLAPEVIRQTLGVATGALELEVLDNTSPAAVRSVAATHDPRRTLFLVSSKSGGTIEVASFEKYFHEWVRASRGEETGRSFVAITDPATELEALARSRGYRRTFINPPDIGGRYSALSFFGLVPAALIGADLDEMLEGARREAETCAAGVAAESSPALVLGAVLGELAQAGRNKLTLALPPGFAALGSWIEQLVAESTGKNGRGIVPIDGEPLAGGEVYGRDRVFVTIEAGPATTSDRDRLDALEAGGQAVLRWSREPFEASAAAATPGRAQALGAEFLRWEIATATAGAVMALDPFDEPNVAEAKAATQAVLSRFLETGTIDSPVVLARVGDVQVAAPAAVVARLKGQDGNGPQGPFPLAAGLAGLAQSGDYFAILAYMHRTRDRHGRLERLRVAVRDSRRVATTLGYGPRFLHSTGQLHKGGPNSGVFLQLTADEGEDAAIPGERYTFGSLQKAQALGDYQVLEKRGRRVMRLHLGSNPESALDELLAALESPARV